MTAAHTPGPQGVFQRPTARKDAVRYYGRQAVVAIERTGLTPKQLAAERDQLRQQVAELVGALRTMLRLPLEQVEGSGPDARDRIIKAADNARAILAKHAKVSA